MNASCINAQGRLAWFPTSTTLDVSALGLALAKISVNAMRGRLYLLGMLPARDGSDQLKKARIPLGLFDVPADHKVAEKRRALLQRQAHQPQHLSGLRKPL